MIEITKDTISDILSSNKVVVLDFWAPWCSPCKRQLVILEAAEAKYPDIVFGKIDVDEENELAAQYNIKSIPLVMIYVNNNMVFSYSGLFNSQNIEKELNRAIEQ